MRSVVRALVFLAAGFALGGAAGTRSDGPKAGGAAKQAGDRMALACYEQARTETTLSNEDALALCIGADSLAPLACFIEASRFAILTQQELVLLCRCTDDLEPVACFVRAQENTTLTSSQLVAVCAPIVQESLLPSCDPID